MTHAVLTGPISGTVTCADGTTYDVTPQLVEVADHHAAEVAHLIGLRYATEGHPNVPVDDEHPNGFEYDASHYQDAQEG